MASRAFLLLVGVALFFGSGESSPTAVCGDYLYTSDGRIYNPSAMTRPSGSPYTATVGRYTYSLNVCGAVACGSETNVAVCQKYGDSVKSLGDLMASQISVSAFGSDDGFTLIYEDGDSCADGTPRSTIVSVVCTDDKEPLLVFEGEIQHCVYEFTLKSREGCSVPVTSQTEVSSGATCDSTFTSPHGYVYSIEALTAPMNAPFSVTVPKTPTSPALTFNVNICGPVSCPGSDLSSGSSIGVCQSYTSKGAVNYMALGVLSSANVSMSLTGDEGGGYTLNYGSGDPCGADPTLLSETIIEVQCDSSAVVPNLVFLGEIDTCFFSFILRAAAACPIASPSHTSSSSSPSSSGSSSSSTASGLSSTCTDKLFVDTSKAAYYDISSLTKVMGSGYSVNGRTSDHSSLNTFTINPCGTVTCTGNHLPAGAQVSACQNWTTSHPTDEHFRALGVLGSTHLTPLATGNGFSVAIDGGDTCGGGNTRHTFLTVTCTTGASSLTYFPSSESCSYVFELEHSSGCAVPSDSSSGSAPAGPSVACGNTLYDDAAKTHFYDTSSLESAVLATTSGADAFLVGFCNAVVCGSQSGVGACDTTSTSSADITKSIGASATGMLTPRGVSGVANSFTLTYTGGAACGSSKRSTVVTFLCDTDAPKSAPLETLIDTDSTPDCVYEFEYYTSAACKVPVPSASVTSSSSTSSDGRKGSDAGLVVVLVFLIVFVAVILVVLLIKSRNSGPSSPWSTSSSSNPFANVDCSRLRGCCSRDQYRFEPMGVN